MKRIILKRIKFSSYLKFCALNGAVMGIAFGIIAIIVGIFDGPVNANFGSYQATGIVAGIICFFLFPFTWSLLSLFIGLVAFLPLKGGLRVLKGLKMDVDYEDEDGLTALNADERIIVRTSEEEL